MAARETTTRTRATADESRRVAYRVMAQAGRRGRINDHLHRELAGSNLSSRQKSFVTEVVLGATRMQGLLDAQLTDCYTGRYHHLENGVKALLRMGAYQIRFMDSVPDRAAVHTTVELAKGVSLNRATGLINAVLRKLSQTAPPEPTSATASAGCSPFVDHGKNDPSRCENALSPSFSNNCSSNVFTSRSSKADKIERAFGDGRFPALPVPLRLVKPFLAKAAFRTGDWWKKRSGWAGNRQVRG
ncbi:MAG: hypothetical protein IID42_10130 [Planctomycetes bacterium]|nr:hypothetical protein [Planctomycetota bacterium]